MKNRKSYIIDAENKKNLFLLIGLTLSLALTVFFLEYRSYENGAGDLGKLSFVKMMRLQSYNRTPPPPPPPPPPAPRGNPNRDDPEIEEVGESTETDESEEIEIVEEVEEDDEIFNFAVVENKPVFQAVRSVQPKTRNSCVSIEIMKHIGKNFEFPELARQMGIKEKYM